MHNERLSKGILEELNAAFPKKLGLPELKAALPGYSHISDEDWFLSIDALRKETLIRGTFYERGAHKVLHGAVNMEITALGRERLGRIELSIGETLRDDLDEVTQLHQRRQFKRDIENLVHQASDLQPLSLIMLDVDHFKKINDEYGDPFGDRVLREIAGTIKVGSENRGSCYRYGGEELAILLPNHPLDDAATLGERIRIRIEQLKYEKGPDCITVSLGIAAYPETTAQKDSDQLISDADRALYEAKGAGRNRICRAPRGQN